jgi:hypothetical protein
MPIDTHTPVPNDKLSKWFFAVQHAQFLIQQRVVQTHMQDGDASYDMRQLATLDDLAMFLSMSWNAWLDQLEDSAGGATDASRTARECMSVEGSSHE